MNQKLTKQNKQQIEALMSTLLHNRQQYAQIIYKLCEQIEKQKSLSKQQVLETAYYKNALETVLAELEVEQCKSERLAHELYQANLQKEGRMQTTVSISSAASSQTSGLSRLNVFREVLAPIFKQ